VARDIDSLTSFTLKHLRDRWWDAAFTEFLRDVLQPQPRERILDVGCGAGTAELILTLLQGSGAGAAENGVTHFVGIDVVKSRLRAARRAAREHALRSELAVADAVSLPFADRSFDGTFAVAVLQQVERPERVIAELARVLRPGGHLVAVTNYLDHLHELRALATERPNPEWAFSGDNGRGLLERHFAALEEHDAGGAIEFHDRDAVVSYIRSSISLMGDAEARLPEFEPPFVVRRHPTIFVARKA
jgi:SAM-dependent methyltransferase